MKTKKINILAPDQEMSESESQKHQRHIRCLRHQETCPRFQKELEGPSCLQWFPPDYEKVKCLVSKLSSLWPSYSGNEIHHEIHPRFIFCFSASLSLNAPTAFLPLPPLPAPQATTLMKSWRGFATCRFQRPRGKKL